MANCFDSIFDSIHKMLSTTSPLDSDGRNHQDDVNIFIEKEDNIQKAIVRSLASYRGTAHTSRLSLKIFVCNHDLFIGLDLERNANQFKNNLEEKMETELGIAFKSIIVTKNRPDDPSKCKLIKGTGFDDIYYTISETANYATISVLDGYGSLLNGTIRIEPDKTYNIGRGKQTQTSAGMIRVNDIVIDDDPCCTAYERNKYVSRCHAHISKGFLLYVDEGGTRLNKNRTRIQREGFNEPIDLMSNTHTPVPLQNGDIIELGKNVMLRFKLSD